MSPQKAPTFADRLPPVVPKEEADIGHLSDEMAAVLYPGRRPQPFRMGLLFEPLPAPEEEKALALARQADVFREETEGGRTLHRVEFGAGSAARLRELFALVGERPGTEVLVDGRRVPYARELWLPLFWILV